MKQKDWKKLLTEGRKLVTEGFEGEVEQALDKIKLHNGSDYVIDNYAKLGGKTITAITDFKPNLGDKIFATLRKEFSHLNPKYEKKEKLIWFPELEGD